MVSGRDGPWGQAIMALACWTSHLIGTMLASFCLLSVSPEFFLAESWHSSTPSANQSKRLSNQYTPLWSTASQVLGAVLTCWFIYPIMYFGNSLDALNYPPMSSGTFDTTGARYNVSRVLNSDYTLDQAAMDAYSEPRWSPSYAMYFFWGFAASTGALLYAVLWYGKESYIAVMDSWKGRDNDYNDPYLRLMSRCPRVPHWWYLTLLAVCFALSLGTIYGAGLGLPWWGFVLIVVVSTICTFPNGILWGVANIQVGMAFLSELLAGAMFPGNPSAVLTCMVYGRQILSQVSLFRITCRSKCVPNQV